jgi:hypothetical protein
MPGVQIALAFSPLFHYMQRISRSDRESAGRLRLPDTRKVKVMNGPCWTTSRQPGGKINKASWSKQTTARTRKV